GSGICINPECSVVVTAGHIQMLIGKATLGVSGAQTDKVLSLAQSMDSGKVDIRADGKTSVITSKAANGYHFKTGQRSGRPGLRLFYPAASCGGKSVLVRQLRGPHLSTWPWCSKRSSIALTAAASPSSLPQSSTGRFEVSMVLARS